MRNQLALAVMAATMWLVNPAPATERDVALSALQKCVAEKDDARRLICFDAEMARLAALPPPAPPPTPEEKFGARGDLKRDIEQPGKVAESTLEKLEGKVQSVATRPGGGLIVTLDNGQVWQQLATGESLQLKAGDSVTLKPGVLGSYSLVGARNRSIKVKRIK